MTLRIDSDRGNRLTGFIAGATNRLVAQPNGPAQACVEDSDGDNVVGLTRLVGTFSPTGQTREHVLLAIEPDREVDESGTYRISVYVGGQTLFNGPVRVALGDFNRDTS